MAEKSRRGFAVMAPDKQREIASKGGKAAHQKGTAHEFTPEEARAAGRKGGLAAHQKARERQTIANNDWETAHRTGPETPASPFPPSESPVAQPISERQPEATPMSHG